MYATCVPRGDHTGDEIDEVADEEAMIAAARSRGFSPVDDNEADAIAILLWAIETQGGQA